MTSFAGAPAGESASDCGGESGRAPGSELRGDSAGVEFRPGVVIPMVAGVRIVPMQPADVPEVVALEAELFAADSPWTAAMFLGELRSGWPYWVARAELEPGSQVTGRAVTTARSEQQGALLGYAGLAVGPDDADVQTIGIAERARGRGLGRALLRTLLAAAGDRAIHLEVRTDNAVAIALYVSEGFEQVGLRRRYYRPSGADAFTMIRPRPDRAIG